MQFRMLLAIFPVFCLTFISPAQDTKENANFKLAVNLYNDKLYDLALEQFRQFTIAYPNTANGIEARYYLGLAQMKMEKFDDARLTFQNFALAFPDNPKAPDAWWNVAESYVTLKNMREAALAFERVKTFHPRSKLAPSALLKASEYFRLTNDRESSKKVLRTLVQEYGSADVVLTARLTLAGIYYQENQFELARAEAKRVADGSKDPQSRSRALLTLADALRRLGKYEDARAALTEIIATYRTLPAYYEAMNSLGNLHQQLGNAQEAIATWKSIASDSMQAPAALRQEALIETGDAYAHRTDYSNALQYYERATRIQASRRGEALYKAGTMAERTRAPSKAVIYYSQAVRDTLAETDRKRAYLGLMKSAVAANNYIDALRATQNFRDRFNTDPEIPTVLFEKGEIELKQMKDPRLAMASYQEVLNRFPENGLVDDALFGYAAALVQTSSFEEAVQAYESLLRRYPASEFVPQAWDRIRYLQLFELKNKETGLEKLALLLGDVIAQQSKGDLSFRLAEIYFHELKDYDRAAQQYRFALDAGLEPEKRVTAWFRLAKSFENLSLNATNKSTATVQSYVQRSLTAYDSLLKKYPTNEFYDGAVVSQFQGELKLAKTLDDVRKLGIEFLLDHSSVDKQGEAFLSLGRAYERFGGLEDARATYKLLLKNYGQSPAAPEAAYQLALVFEQVGKPDSSFVLLKEYQTRYPASAHAADAAWLLAQGSVGRGQLDQALSAYQTIEQSFYYTRYRNQLDLARAEAYYRTQKPDRAIPYYVTLLSRDNVQDLPSSVYFNLASSYDQTGDREQAKKYYTWYLLRDTSAARIGDAYFALARIAREEKNLELATQYLEAAARSAGTSSGKASQAALEVGELFFRTEDYENALKRFSEVLQQTKADSLVRYLQSRIVVCYFRLDNVKEAEARAALFLKTFSRTDNQEAEFEFERGQVYLRRKDYDPARKSFDLVVRKYPEAAIVPEAIYWTARAFEMTGKQQEAVKTYESIIQKYPTNSIIPRTQLSLGNVYYNLEQWDPAARLYKMIVDNPQRSPELLQYAMNNLIVTYKELGLYDAALQLTRQYIDRYPDDPELINKRIDIGVLYQKLGYYDQSVLHLQSLLENADADLESEVRYYIGEAYFYKGDYQQAILEFLKVPYLVTKRTKVDWVATSYYMAGQAYEKMSKFDQAITMYRQIISRSGIDATFKTAAQKEIDRVNALVKANK